MVVVFRYYVFTEKRLKDFCDSFGITLVDQTTITVMGINDCPITGIVEITGTMPTEAIEVLPVSGRFSAAVLSSISPSRMIISICLNDEPLVGVQFTDQMGIGSNAQNPVGYEKRKVEWKKFPIFRSDTYSGCGWF